MIDVKQDQTQLITDVQDRYGIGPSYARAYLDYWFRTRDREYASLQKILDLPPPEPMWFEYALSANWRGQQVCQLIAQYVPRTAQRYLDVGCGFGGCLVAFSKLGMEVRGIEIDAQRIGLANANCLDQNLSNCVLQASILDDDLVSRLGTFDVISLVDVIEHVLDVPKTLRNTVELLSPGGILVLEIPNKHSLNFVAHDGHFGLFGITLLQRPDAIEYHKTFFGFDYEVGDYYDLDYYQHQLEELGCACSLLTSPLHPPRRLGKIGSLLLAMLRSYIEYRGKDRPSLSPRLNRKIQTQLAKYLSILVQDFTCLVVHPRGIGLFQNKYLTDFWTLMAQKS